MYNFTSSRTVNLYALLQSGGSRVINNTTGTFTNTGFSKILFDSLNWKRKNDINSPTFKTGSSSMLRGVRGRQGVDSLTLTMPIIPYGAAGTIPDSDPILETVFGSAATISAGVSATYSLSDALKFLTLLRYNKTPGLTTPTNHYFLGLTPQTFKIMGGQNFLMLEVTFTGVGIGNSLDFSGYTGSQDAILAGGLTTYPAEPTGFVSHGSVIQGFGGGAGVSIGGSTVAELRGTVEISGALGVEPLADAVGDPYPVGFARGARMISINNITCADSDGSVLNTVKQAAFSKTPEAVVFTFGNVAGSIVTATVNNVQLGSDSYSDAGAFLNIAFDKSDAHETTAGAKDDFTLAFS
jgi:hypothetical protein